MSPVPESVGIDALGVAFPRCFLALEDLAVARSVPSAKYVVGLGTVAMAVPEPDEDTVTLAAAAAGDALVRGGVDPREIGLCIVGTETAVDHSKPVSSFLQGLLDLPSTCRIFEAKHACYGGTAGLMTALDWIRSGSARGRKALVVCSDIARYGLHTAGEPTQGAGAVALVVSESPRVVALDSTTVGTSSRHVFDFFRPIDSKDAVVDGHYSVACYLDALRSAWEEHRRLGGAATPADRAATLFHVPYPKMAVKAHRLLCDLERRSADVEAAFDRLVAPSLVLPSRIGNVYTGSLNFALASAIAYGDVEGGELSFFSYGSGCCAEMFAGRVPKGAKALVGSFDARLEARRRICVEDYEHLLEQRDRWMPIDDGLRTPRRPRLRGIEDGRRIYA